jgi:type III restriction enzyme
VILEYKIDDESKFQGIFESYLLDNQESFKPRGSITQTKRLTFDQGLASLQEEDDLNNEILPIVTLHYRQFIEELAVLLGANMITLHKAFVAVKDDLNINDYLSHQTIRTIKAQFHKYLLDHAFSKFHIGYQQVSNKVHPTVFTNEKGKPLTNIPAHNLGVHFDESKPADQYLFEEVFFDSSLEQENIKKSIAGVTVFTKIPRNSIRIPVAGGGTYSPDFAYVIEYDGGHKQLNLIIETKDKEKRALFDDEKQRIKHAQELFSSLKQGFEVRFETQFKNAQIKEILQQAIKETVAD